MSTVDAPTRPRGRRAAHADLVPVRLALAGAIAVVLVESLIYFFHIRHQVGGFGDLLGRVSNFRDLRATGNIYANFAIEGFTYPPGGILLLSPIVLLPVGHVGLVWTAGALSALLLTFYLVGREIARLSVSNSLLLASALTIASPVLWSSVYDVLFWGQVGSVITLLVVSDFLAVRGTSQGVLVGLATTLKIYPGVFIVIWLLRRQFRPALTALATVAVTTALATLFWYDSAISFFHNELVGNQELSHFSTYTTAQSSAGVDDIFFRPPYFLGHLSASAAMGVSALVAVVGIAAALWAWQREFVMTGLVLTLVISAICSPIAWNHYFVFLPLMLFVPRELGWRSPTALACSFALAVNVLPWHRWQLAGAIQILLPAGQRHLSYVAQNATLVTMLIVVVAAVVEFRPQRFRRRRRSTEVAVAAAGDSAPTASS